MKRRPHRSETALDLEERAEEAIGNVADALQKGDSSRVLRALDRLRFDVAADPAEQRTRNWREVLGALDALQTACTSRDAAAFADAADRLRRACLAR